MNVLLRDRIEVEKRNNRSQRPEAEFIHFRSTPVITRLVDIAHRINEKGSFKGEQRDERREGIDGDLDES